MSANVHVIRLRILCLNPPPEGDTRSLIFGLQDKQGNLQSGQPHSDGALIYECEVKASRNEKGKPNFTGNYTHGTPDERFLYISVRSVGGSNWQWRSKIMLSGITWEMVEAASAANSPIEITVEGIVAARAKIVRGWEVAQS